MKKIITLLITVAALISCESDVKTSNHSIQAVKDNNSWKSDRTDVKIDNGYMTIHAYRGSEQLDLVFKSPTGAVNSNNNQVYYFGRESVDKSQEFGSNYVHDPKNVVKYKYVEEGVTFVYGTTEKTGDGQIVITSFDPVGGRISGNFRCNASYEGDLGSVPSDVNFQQGFIFDISVPDKL